MHVECMNKHLAVVKLLTEPEIDEYVIHPAIRGQQCVECGCFPEVEGKDWYTCSVCGKVVCLEHAKTHNPLCFAKTWELAETTPEGELVPVDKPRRFTL